MIQQDVRAFVQDITVIQLKINLLHDTGHVERGNIMGLLSEAAKQAIRKGKAAKKSKPTQPLFGGKFVSQLDEGQAPSRGILDVEAGKAGKVTVGSRSMPTMQEAASLGSRARARMVATLETKKEKGEITASEQRALDRLNKLSEQQDIARTSAASKTKQDAASKAKGVTLAEMEGPVTVGKKEKLKASDMMVGNTDNGITKDGEIIGNPTDNQIKIVVRNLEARERLSADAKRNLARLKRMSQRDRQDAALRKMERNLKDTGADKSGRPFNRGGVVRNGHTDYRSKGMFYK